MNSTHCTDTQCAINDSHNQHSVLLTTLIKIDKCFTICAGVTNGIVFLLHYINHNDCPEAGPNHEYSTTAWFHLAFSQRSSNADALSRVILSQSTVSQAAEQ